MATELKYLENYAQLEDESKVVQVDEIEGRTVVILDQTIFYPQGGGQPYDKGTLESPNGKFIVEEVRFVEGIVRHIGQFENGKFTSGETVKCLVNKKRRELNSKLHSAGHLVDMAVNDLQLSWIPAKGYHFPDGPYVEYEGSLEGQDIEKLKADLEKLCDNHITEGLETKVQFMEKDKMKEVCHFVPEFIPEGKPTRVVLFGDFGVPCGGTHVEHLGELGKITIRKLKQEGPNIRIGYDAER